MTTRIDQSETLFPSPPPPHPPPPHAPPVLGSFKDGLLFSIGNPLASAFPTISNDPSGNRAYPPGANEINARTIKPKVKDFDKSKRVTGIPGFNAFGAPSSKSGNPLADFFGGN